MTEAERRAHAERLIRQHNDDYEFCLVYEDDELWNKGHAEQSAIHDLMHSAVIKIEWRDEK